MAKSRASPSPASYTGSFRIATRLRDENTGSEDREHPPRLRRFTPRSRTGCSTCRARRVKCDEAQPVCMRCLKAGRQCTGGSVFVGPALGSAVPVVPKRMELAVHHYFRTQYASVAVAEFNREFWYRLLPQMTHGVRAIWHASLALGGAMWSMNDSAGLSREVVTMLDVESAGQHSAAVRELVQMTQAVSILCARDKLTILLANCMFSTYACGFSNWKSALGIQANSRRLIREWRFWELLHSPPLSAAATYVMYFLIKSERMLQESQLAVSEKRCEGWYEALAFLQRRPLDFVPQAYLELDMLWSSVMGIVDELPLCPTDEHLEAVDSGRARYLPQFLEWEERYQAFVSSSPISDPIQAAAIDARRILLGLVFKMNFGQIDGLRDETCWDAAEEDLNAVFRIIESTFVKTAASGKERTSFTPSLWNSLNFVASRSRDSVLRRKAAALLRCCIDEALARMPRGCHGFKQAEPAVNFLVDRIIDLEEGFGTKCGESPRCVPGSFICNAHRVGKVLIELPGARPSTFTLFTMGDVRDGMPGRKVVLRVPAWS